MKLTKEKICAIVTLAYHCLFLSGASLYVTEFQKTRDVIIAQGKAIEQEGAKLNKRAEKIRTSIVGLGIKIESVGNKLDDVKKTCEKLRF